MKEIEFIENVLQETAALVREKYARKAEIYVSSKSHVTDLLTEADLAAQDHIVAQIRRVYGSDAVAAEEREFCHAPDDPNVRCWVIDPIDGTQNFVRGIFPTFAISIAFAVGGAPAIAGISLPIPGDVFLAERGAGASRNGESIRVSKIGDIGVCRFEVDFDGPPLRNKTLDCARDLMPRVGQMRCHGSSVASLCAIACGEAEGFLHVTLNPWDYAAGKLLVEEAGGKTSRLDGTPLRLFDEKHGVLATNGLIHDEALKLLRKS